jgi:hypothetical protein
LTQVAANDDGGVDLTSTVTFPAVGGTTYQIAVDGYNGASGALNLQWNLVVLPPANDNFANAQSVSGTTGQVLGAENPGATKEPGEPNHYGNPGGKSVWYRWTAPTAGNASVDTSGSTFDTLLAVYTGSAVNALTQVAANDDGGVDLTSTVTFPAVGGTTYQIAVDGYYGASGTLNLRWNLTGAGGPGGRYTPLTPARILDTRDGTGGVSGPLGSGATVEVQIAGRGGVPASGVSAVAMNVTVTEPSASGYLTIYPAGDSRPLAANLNFTPGKTVPNLVVVKLGTAGRVEMFNSAGNTYVIYDVAGWYSDSGSGDAGRYTALVPARILDTRDGTGGGVRLNPGARVDVQVAGQGGVPGAGASAGVLNVAVTNATAVSFLTAYPTGEARPLAANLNFKAGDTVSNRVMVKLGAGGKVTIFNNSGSTDVIVDVGGWFSDSSVPGSTGTYTALAPARILDTRDATGGIAGPLGGGTNVDVQVTGRGGVPATGVSAVILNATVVGPAILGYLTISPTGSPIPLASDLNYAAGEIRPNLVVVRVGTGGKINLYTSARSHVVFDVAGWVS